MDSTSSEVGFELYHFALKLPRSDFSESLLVLVVQSQACILHENNYVSL